MMKPPEITVQGEIINVLGVLGALPMQAWNMLRGKTMDRFLKMMFVIFCVLLFPLFAGAAVQPPAAGEEFPEIKLPVPSDRIERAYLGIGKGKDLQVPDINADVVIVEILSMYCPFCQVEAPKMNELFFRIEKDPALKDRIKIIGIAAGNSPFEAQVFQKKYNVPFPVFPDADFSVHKALGEVRTPYFIGVRIVKKKAHVFYSELGAFEEVSAFLNLILEESGLGGKEASQ